MLGSCENDDLASGCLAQQVQQQASLQLFGNWIQRVRHRIGRRVGIDLNINRIVKYALGQPADLLRHRCGEKQGLALRG
jgi:hypothetical protein